MEGDFLYVLLTEKPSVTIAGYPGDPHRGKYMYQMNGPITEHRANQTLYNVDTTPGQSGSGVWTKDFDCVAVHTCGSSPYNGGTRLHTSYADRVKKWLN